MASAPSTPAGLTPASSTTPTTSRPGTPGVSTPPSVAIGEKPADDSSKIKILLSLLRKFIGVADIANVRFSLPAQLMEPIPNLEYWQYLDRPETFVSLGKSDSDIGRMLEVLRFHFTKDLKFIKGKPCKPYNSVLGEFFRCNWDIHEEAPPIDVPSKAPHQPAPDPVQSGKEDVVRCTFLCEQTSHHPPVSAYWYECPERGISMRGYDQLSAKFSGTYVRVVTGNYNKGIFINLAQRDNEEYYLKHPDSQLNGILRGSPYISVADTFAVKCAKTKLKTILQYIEDSYFGKAQNKVLGVMYRFDPDNDRYSKPKDVPEKDVLVKFDGDWKGKIFYTIPASEAVKNEPHLEPTTEPQLIMDVGPLMPVPKVLPPLDDQLDSESRKFWQDVTDAIHDRRYGDATRAKQDIEQTQRDRAAAREKEKTSYKSWFFTTCLDESGKPELTDEGRRVVEDMSKLQFHMEPRLNDSA